MSTSKRKKARRNEAKINQESRIPGQLNSAEDQRQPDDANRKIVTLTINKHQVCVPKKNHKLKKPFGEKPTCKKTRDNTTKIKNLTFAQKRP